MTDARQEASQARSELRQTEAAFEAMKSAAVKAWMQTRDGEAAHREQLYRAVQVIDTVRQHLIQVVANGDLEEAAQAFAKGLTQPE